MTVLPQLTFFDNKDAVHKKTELSLRSNKIVIDP